MACESSSFLLRFDSRGHLDSTFGSNGVFVIHVPDPPTSSTMVDVYDVLVQKNGSFLMMATVRNYHALEPYLAIIRVTPHGQFDVTFDGDGAFIYYDPAVDHYGCALAVQPSGRIIAMGSEGPYNNLASFLLGITANGAIDTGFGSAGKTVLPESSCSLLTLPTNGIVTAGFANANLVVRMFDPDGTVNPFFANGWMAASDSLGSPNALHLQSNGKIVLTSSINNQTFVARLKLLFEDVNYFHWAQPWIERLYASGITGGAQPTRLCIAPRSLSHAPRWPSSCFAASMVLRTPRHRLVAAPASPTDVPVSHPSAAWIKQLAAEGITSGCGGGNYCPNNPVSRTQMAFFLLRSKYDPSYTPPPVGASTGFADVPVDSPAAPRSSNSSPRGLPLVVGEATTVPPTL